MLNAKRKFMKTKIAFLSFFLFISSFGFAQKAYETFYYSGKVQNITVLFSLADGYMGANQIKTTDNTSKKISQFLPASGAPTSNLKMKFYHYSKSGKKFTDYFILEGIDESYNELPEKIIGKYYFNNKEYNLILLKQ